MDRREDPVDRRCKRLSATAAGREQVHRLDDARRAALEAFAQTIEPGRRERLATALTDILDELEGRR
jgi:DNA-binding MarR family transcriptional regulator